MSEEVYIDLYDRNQEELQEWMFTQKHDGEWQESYYTKSYAMSAWECSYDQTAMAFKSSVDKITKKQWSDYLEGCDSESEMNIVLNIINNIRKELSLEEIEL